jgi:hypothetical protein
LLERRKKGEVRCVFQGWQVQHGRAIASQITTNKRNSKRKTTDENTEEEKNKDSDDTSTETGVDNTGCGGGTKQSNRVDIGEERGRCNEENKEQKKSCVALFLLFCFPSLRLPIHEFTHREGRSKPKKKKESRQDGGLERTV